MPAPLTHELADHSFETGSLLSKTCESEISKGIAVNATHLGIIATNCILKLDVLSSGHVVGEIVQIANIVPSLVR